MCLGFMGEILGSREGFEDHRCVLLILAKEMRTANPHCLLPHQKGVVLGVLNCKPTHGAVVQCPIYKMLHLPHGCHGSAAVS